MFAWYSKVVSLFALALCLFMAATSAHAQVWKAGKSQLMSGKYAAAEATLTKAYRQSKTPQEKAATLKYLGVAQFMQRKESQAAAMFRMALKLDPTLKLQDSEVADESVIPFFNRQRGSIAQTAKPSATTAAARPASGKPGATPPPSVKKSKKTLVRVVSNVPSAQISIDGIAYGSAGSDIEVQPGTVILEVGAPGYIKKAVKINVAAFTANTLTVNLEKPQPKAPPPKPKAVAKAIPLPPTNSGKGQSATKSKVKSSKDNDLFGADPGSADDFAAIPQQPQQPALPPLPNPASQAQSIAPPAAPAQPVLPQGAYGSPYLQQPMYMAPQPMYQQPMYQQPMYQQPMYQQPMYQQPMYQQPMYQQPMPQQPAPPSVYAPYSGGGYSQQPQAPVYDSGIAAPPIEPPPGSTVPGGPGFGTASDPGLPPPMIPPTNFGKSSKKNRNASTKPADGCSTFIKLLPFGAGQFCQHSYFKGTLFLGAEIGALYFYKTNSDSATTNTNAMSKYKSDRESDPSAGTAAYDEETNSHLASGQKTIDTANQNAMYSLVIFGGSWALGVADAIFFPPSGGKAKKTLKKARLSLLLDPDVETKPTLALLTPMSLGGNDEGLWYAGYTPALSDRNSGAVKLGMAWDL